MFSHTKKNALYMHFPHIYTKYRCIPQSQLLRTRNEKNIFYQSLQNQLYEISPHSQIIFMIIDTINYMW